MSPWIVGAWNWASRQNEKMKKSLFPSKWTLPLGFIYGFSLVDLLPRSSRMGKKRKQRDAEKTELEIKEGEDAAPERPKRTILGWKEKPQEDDSTLSPSFRNKEKALVTCSRRINFRWGLLLLFLSLPFSSKKKKNQPFRSQFLFLVVCVNCELVIIKLLDMTGRLILFSVEEIEFISEAPSINRFIFKDLCYCCSLLFQLVQFLSWDTGSSCGVMSGGFLKFYISDVLGAGIWCLIWSHFYLTVKRITRLNRRKLKVPLLMSWSSFEIALHACFSRLNFFSFLEYFSFSRLRYLHIEAKKKKRLWSLAYACQSISRCSVIV